MKKGQIYSGIVEYVDFPDKAVVLTKETDINGIEKKYFVKVKGALPGQEIEYIVKKARQDKCQGRLTRIIKKSPYETEEPACIQYGICGGCSYQTLPYKTQLELKKKQVLKLVNNVVEEGSYIFDGIFPGPCIWEYRNKMEFSFGDEYKGGPLSLGLHKKGSIHDVINASGCKIVNNDYSKILDCVKEFFTGRHVPHYNKNTHIGILRHLLIRRAASTGEILVALVTTSALADVIEWSGLEELGSKLQDLDLDGKITGFLHIINDGLGDVVKSEGIYTVFGKDWILEEILGLKFKVSVFSFFQTNTKGAEVLYNCARNYILGDTINDVQESSIDGKLEDITLDEKSGKCDNICVAKEDGMDRCNKGDNGFKDKVVFDLYSGTGTIAQIIAPVAKKVIGVEIVEEAVLAARQNAEFNGLSNCEFIAGDVLEVLDMVDEKPGFIILDPPREGINPKVLKKIIGFGVDRIVYISCKPASLARDLAVMQEWGYKVERMVCVDMFPQTAHVESVCLLHRRDS